MQPDFDAFFHFLSFKMGISRVQGKCWFKIMDNEQPGVRVVALPLDGELVDRLERLYLLAKTMNDSQEGSDG